MTMQYHKAGANHVIEVAESNRNLIEKAFYMRCASYLSFVKSQLLTQTIFEIDSTKKDLIKNNKALKEEVPFRKVYGDLRSVI